MKPPRLFGVLLLMVTVRSCLSMTFLSTANDEQFTVAATYSDDTMFVTESTDAADVTDLITTSEELVDYTTELSDVLSPTVPTEVTSATDLMNTVDTVEPLLVTVASTARSETTSSAIVHNTQRLTTAEELTASDELVHWNDRTTRTLASAGSTTAETTTLASAGSTTAETTTLASAGSTTADITLGLSPSISNARTDLPLSPVTLTSADANIAIWSTSKMSSDDVKNISVSTQTTFPVTLRSIFSTSAPPTLSARNEGVTEISTPIHLPTVTERLATTYLPPSSSGSNESALLLKSSSATDSISTSTRWPFSTTYQGNLTTAAAPETSRNTFTSSRSAASTGSSVPGTTKSDATIATPVTLTSSTNNIGTFSTAATTTTASNYEKTQSVPQTWLPTAQATFTTTKPVVTLSTTPKPVITLSTTPKPVISLRTTRQYVKTSTPATSRASMHLVSVCRIFSAVFVMLKLPDYYVP